MEGLDLNPVPMEFIFLWPLWDYNDMKEVKDGSFSIDSLETHFQPLGDPPKLGIIGNFCVGHGR